MATEKIQHAFPEEYLPGKSPSQAARTLKEASIVWKDRYRRNLPILHGNMAQEATYRDLIRRLIELEERAETDVSDTTQETQSTGGGGVQAAGDTAGPVHIPQDLGVVNHGAAPTSSSRNQGVRVRGQALQELPPARSVDTILNGNILMQHATGER